MQNLSAIKSGVKKQDLFKSENSPNFIGRDAIQVKSRLSAKTKAAVDKAGTAFIATIQ